MSPSVAMSLEPKAHVAAGESCSVNTDVIPQPAEVVHLEGRCVLRPSTPVEAFAAAAEPAAVFLRTQLRQGLAARSVVAQVGDAASDRAIHQSVRLLQSATDQGAEGYHLRVEPTGVVLEASAAAGWFYGVQTLLQLLPADSTAESWSIECVRITDSPRFRWRGLMLDVSRHLMPVDGLLRLLDTMAAHKLNVFHWHLTDDQGWRIQSERFPRLTEIGAWRRGSDGTLTPGRSQQETAPAAEPGSEKSSPKYGGFYSHDDIRAVVAYAADLHITVVPEIEMPGHAVAALSAYPELSCTGGPFEPETRTGIFKDVYCAGNEASFRLLQGVLEEVLPLFPGEYVHIGGDECPKTRWSSCPRCQRRIREEGLKDEHELQSYVIRRMEKFLTRHGKRLIGWDEILEGGLPPRATVMSWRGTEGGIAAARLGHDVVMTPHTHCYLDYKQAADGEPVAIPHGLTPLEKTYSYEPIPPELTPEQADHVLGVQGNLWTEYVPDIGHAEYMLWPRAAAVAEIGWSPADSKNFDEFARRVRSNEDRLRGRGVRYRPFSPKTSDDDAG